MTPVALQGADATPSVAMVPRILLLGRLAPRWAWLALEGDTFAVDEPRHLDEPVGVGHWGSLLVAHSFVCRELPVHEADARMCGC